LTGTKLRNRKQIGSSTLALGRCAPRKARICLVQQIYLASYK
jgi:hypothetical protein